MIVHLDINTYRGMSFSAIHYYAELNWTDCDPAAEDSWKHHQHGRVYGKLTSKEAKLTNITGSRTSEGKKYKAGDTCFGWLTEEDAIEHGVAKFKSTFNLKKDILVLGNASSAEPQPILHGPAELKEKIQARIDGIQKAEDAGNKKLESELGDQFWEFWKTFEKTQKNRVVKFDEWAGIHDSE